MIEITHTIILKMVFNIVEEIKKNQMIMTKFRIVSNPRMNIKMTNSIGEEIGSSFDESS